MNKVTGQALKRTLRACRQAKIWIDPRIKGYRPPTWRSISSPLNIAIVGAGIAGLASAWLLREQGHTVFVFEAQDRPGGRIYTVEMDSIPVEVGAARFSDRHSRALHWIRKFDLQLEPMYAQYGRLVKLDKTERQISRNVSALSNHDTHHLVSFSESWPKRLESTKSPAFRLIVKSITRPTWYRIKGGNAQLPRRIADELSGLMSYESPVSKIVQGKDKVELTYRIDGTRHRRSFDRCIIAVPLSTLSDIAFQPPLSDAKRLHLEGIRTQPAVRSIAIIRNRSAIEQEGLSGFGCTSNGFEIWQPSFASRSASMTLSLYAQGEAAVPLLELDDAARSQAALEVFEQMFPGTERDAIDTMSYSWVDDPWARGAQALFDKRDVNIREALGRTEGRLHFAGDYTTGGWINDVFASVDRVVSEVAFGSVAT